MSILFSIATAKQDSTNYNIMTTKTYHIISSALVRHNGIVEFIRASIEKFGGVMVTDQKPEIKLPFPVIFDTKSGHKYQPQLKVTDWGLGPEQHPWLQWPENLVSDLSNLIEKLPQDSKIYTHCAVAQQACYNLDIDSVFVQHESDIYYPQNRLSYLSDEWLSKHQTLMPDCVIGATMPVTAQMKFLDQAATPYPIRHKMKSPNADLGEFVVVMDGSYRKGWDRYLEFWHKNGEPSTSVITQESHSSWPRSWQIRGFDFFQVEEKLQFIRNHQRAFVPSRSEVTCLALLECMSQVPTLVFNDTWTVPYYGQVTVVDHDQVNSK
jgi:hypothetical protein